MKKFILLAALASFTVATHAQSTTTTSSQTKSTSVSISDSGSDYSLFAYFSASDIAGIEKLITDLLGKPLKNSGKVRSWRLEDVYTVSLKSDKLSIELDKRQASASLIKSFIQLGKDLQPVISANQKEQIKPAG